jgi:hypothetical protein
MGEFSFLVEETAAAATVRAPARDILFALIAR